MIRRIACLALCGAFSTSAAFAADPAAIPPPPYPFQEMTWKPTLARNAVTGLVAISAPQAKSAPSCPLLPPKLSPVRLDTPVWLGSRESALPKALAAPSFRNGGWRVYDYEGREPQSGTCDEDFDVINGITVEIIDGVVTTISASQVTSC